MSENALVGAIVVACLVYVVARARRAFKSSGGCGCGGCGEKNGSGCAGCGEKNGSGCAGCDGGEKATSDGRGCGRSE